MYKLLNDLDNNVACRNNGQKTERVEERKSGRKKYNIPETRYESGRNGKKLVKEQKNEKKRERDGRINCIPPKSRVETESLFEDA